MDLGHVSLRAAGRHALVGHGGIGRFPSYARLVLLRLVVGFYIDDQSLSRHASSVSPRLGGVSNAKAGSHGFFGAILRVAPRTGPRDRPRNPMLRSVDHSKLRGVPQARSSAFQFPARALHRQQGKLRRQASALSRHHHERPRDAALFPYGRNSVHGGGKGQADDLHRFSSARRSDPLRRPLRSVLDRPAQRRAKLSVNGLLAGSRPDALRRSFRDGSTRRHRRARSVPQRLRVSARRLPRRFSFPLLHHAHFPSLPPSPRARRSSADGNRSPSGLVYSPSTTDASITDSEAST